MIRRYSKLRWYFFGLVIALATGCFRQMSDVPTLPPPATLVLTVEPTPTNISTPEATRPAALTSTTNIEPIFNFDNLPPVTHNAQWQPQIRIIQGAEMVLVPPGCFFMGSDESPEEAPPHEQCFDQPYWIDRYEVTYALYDPAGSYTQPNQPRDVVSWVEAAQHCRSRDARLPSEAEWEYAARGPDSLIYPWGDEFVSQNVVFRANSNSQPAAVGSRPGGASWVGALDMSGNVWEWTSSLYAPYPFEPDVEPQRIVFDDSLRVIRGGSAINLESPLRAAARGAPQTSHASEFVGFRCALHIDSALD